jgi:paraquat-inducible protein B
MTAPEKIPQAKVKRRRWRVSIVWIVPIVAAIVAGYLVFDRVREMGPQITISFKDGNGLRVGRTVIRYRGVQIGEVTGIELSKDMQRVLVQARLQRSAESIAKDGSVFWIVRLGNEIENISNIGTVITGAYIEVLPGDGEPRSEFVGLENGSGIERGGLKIVLLSNRLGMVRPNWPVYYHGIEVGTIQSSKLNANATAAEIHVLIRARYAPLVRSGSRFWNTSGVDVKMGLFKGVEINVESLRSLLSGGIAFATPDANAKPAKAGAVFRLHDEPHKDWLKWAPAIPLAPEK